MDSEENMGTRTRSFRYEDYNNRRVFLRSYPLDWELGEGDQNDKEDGGDGSTDEMRRSKRSNKDCSSRSKKHLRKIILSLYHWGGGKILVFRRFKHKLTIHVISCIPVGLKPPTALISA
ncbi:hypothetical protein ACE6H2_015369 [Prunus campanulata]